MNTQRTKEQGTHKVVQVTVYPSGDSVPKVIATNLTASKANQLAIRRTSEVDFSKDKEIVSYISCPKSASLHQFTKKSNTTN